MIKTNVYCDVLSLWCAGYKVDVDEDGWSVDVNKREDGDWNPCLTLPSSYYNGLMMGYFGSITRFETHDGVRHLLMTTKLLKIMAPALSWIWDGTRFYADGNTAGIRVNVVEVL